MPAPLALSRFLRRAAAGACKNRSAAPGCRYPNWRRARGALANLDGCPCSSSAVSAAGSASLTQPLTAPCFVHWTRSLFVPPHAGEPPLSVSLRSTALPRGEPSARPWTEVNFVVRQTKRPLLLCGYSKRSRFPLKAPTGARPQDAGGTSMGGGRDSITTMRRPALQPTPAEGPYLS